MSNTTESEDNIDIDPYLKEQNEGILRAFSHEKHKVLTTPEVEEYVELSGRQTRRRLENLEDEGIIGSRKPGRTKLWWLQEEVEEPVSAQYPILKLVQKRVSLQLVALGLLSGVVTVIFTSAATISLAYNISPPFLGANHIIQSGLLMSLLAAGFLIAGGAIAATNWLFEHLGIEIQYQSDS